MNDEELQYVPDSCGGGDDDEFKPFLVAPNRVVVQEEPNGAKQQFRITRHLIEPETKQKAGRSASARFLLLGFDTEYQSLKPLYTHAEVTRKREARYEVLSYQLYAKVDGSVRREILIPDGSTRINFVDFITYALAKVTATGQSVPRSMVLVGHFNKADFPAFADRGQMFKKLVAIRNSLVTLGYPIKIRIMFSDDPADFEEVRVHVRDSMLMAPAGQRSLAAVGELMGIKKIKLHDDPVTELELKRNMKSVRDNLWDLFREYALLDAEISALYFERLTELYRAATQTDRIPTSLSNIGPQLLLKDWGSRDPPIHRLKMIGKESFTEQIWNDATGGFYTQKSEPYIEEIFHHIDFATACFHGGRGEQMWFGPSERDQFSDYDLAGAYPTAMAMLREPLWDTVRPTKDLDDLRREAFAFAWVDFKFPDSVRYPTLPVRTDNGIIFPLEGRSYCCTPEIEVAVNLGAELKVKHAVVIDTTDELAFHTFIKQSIRRRLEATTDPERAFWKEVTNACYGKTAQGLRNKRVFNLKTRNTKTVPESSITNPFFAAYITSLVRAVIGEIINAIPSDKMIFSVTTDGFLTNANSEEIGCAEIGPLASAFKMSRQRLTGSAEILTKKHAVKRLLGIRTRGQATLESEPTAGAKGIVLAKAGIKTPAYTTTPAEQNDYIVEEFLKRQPGRRFVVDTLTTLREIMLFNADTVMKRSERAISMEYDFKRFPNQAWNVDLEYGGRSYSHLAFSTKPWKTVGEFKDVRQIWDTYSQKKIRIKQNDPKAKTKLVRRQVRCLKTMADFAEFGGFHDTRIAVKKEARAYLSSDLSRLRRDLCRAFKQGKAGLEDQRAQMTARQFAELLNRCGFEDDERVTRQHVEYGLRQVFEQHTTPPTKRVLGVLRRLSKVIPSLRSEDIITSLEGLSMLLRAVEPQ